MDCSGGGGGVERGWWNETRNASSTIAEILFSTDPVMQPHSNFPLPPPTLSYHFVCGCVPEKGLRISMHYREVGGRVESNHQE